MLGVEELYHRYRDDVFRYLCSLCHDPALAEDLLSETFLCAIQKAGGFRGEGGEKTWLFGIARNLWLQALRKRRPTVEYNDLLGLYVEDHVGDALDARQLARRVEELLAALPDDGRVLSKIHRRLRLLQGAALVLGVLAAFWLSAFGTRYRLEYSIVILPVAGVLGWLLLRRRWYCVPLAVAALGFVWHALLQDAGGPNWHVRIVVPLVCAAIYGFLCLLGALAAKLFAYAFGKEEPR